MATFETRPTVGRLARAGAVFFALWGVLHAVVGLTGTLGYQQGGPSGVLTAFGGAVAPTQSNAALALAGHVALDFSMGLAIFGALAIWAAVMIWRGQHLGFWLGAVILGAVDAAFILALVLPGYVTGVDAASGPVLYVLGVVFSAAGLFGRRVHGAAPMARASEVRP